MSKIEKALNKARAARSNLPAVMSAPASSATVPTGAGALAERTGHPETIPRMAASEPKMLSASELSWLGIIDPEHTENSVVQVFRDLRTKITLQCQGKNSVILVIGLRNESGGSFVARNLAAAFAFDAAKTALLIDCNLKNPSVHRLIGNASAPGLVDHLQNPDIDIAQIIHPVGIARYRVIPAGAAPSAQEEHFTSVKMRRLIESARHRYEERFVILDGPPASDVADIRILSGLSDYVLIVARYGRATTSQIEQCLSAIGDDKMLGIVFNDEPRFPPGR